ncbi:hypothetical protein NLI96_g7033 [Meripilus lineatus]|uniref:Oxidation resistance protein 1 n=1 Tax=Meripilus lineatus TaxID=2056292 RepID=A0AAD5V1P1_9APHY|nr:hypothetical protein NLI96_g7033 [Physisporinus lineatus]
MSHSINDIPSLIPLPSSSHNSTTTTTTHTSDDKEDIFATLFTPSTPRASPTLAPVPDDRLIDLPPSKPFSHRHTRTVSTDSDFGAFVSVPATEDPLLLQLADGEPSTASAVTSVSFSPLGDLGFFDRFTEGAKAATERNQRKVLDELLEHQDDPLYFLGPPPASDVQLEDRAATPTPSKSSASEEQEEDVVETDALGSLQPLSNSIAIPEASSSTPTFLYQAPNPTDPHHPLLLSLVLLLLPQPPMRLSDPEIQPAQSFFVPPSLASSASFPTNWVSSLLSRPLSSTATVTSNLTRRLSMNNRSASSEDTSSTPGSSSASQSIASLRNHTRSQTYGRNHHHHPPVSIPPHPGVSAPPTLSRSHNRTQTSPALPVGEITHGTPFASHVYIPPSGAPGFAGDRQWNTGGFEFDREKAERKNVKLVGRKELTSVVLTTELAELIRPYFPALARLPRSWTLLYSLDQHGISLNTLYARCTTHQGGTLIVLRDSGDAVFGAWMGEGIHPSKGAYFGSGESFLWKFWPKEKKVKVFKWTGRNDYIALCESDYVSFGGGDGNYGLYLDSTLTDGSSANCITFNNEPLCSAGPKQGDSVTFECVGLEVWGVG